jgi:Bacterial extracellular solute-binding proteins, family 3
MPNLLKHPSLTRACLLMCLVVLSLPSYAAEKHVKYNMPSKVQTDYMQGLMKLALNYSAKKYTFSTTDETYSRPRLMESVINGSVSLMWGGTSDQMESDYLPIRIDAYRGLMSHRVLIIRNGDQARFDAVQTLDDLRKIKFGQGRSWQDASIMKNSGFDVVTSTKKPGLFYMLDGGRFDAFPRGANEAWSEIAAFPTLNLTVEKQLVLVYPLPTYFFVHKGDPELAKDIEDGLEAAIKDGSFDNYFYNSKEVKDALDRADLPNRRAFHIKNPFLPKATPLERKELWISLDDLRARTAKSAP